MIRIAIVILNWNGRHFLEKFLPTVIEYSAGKGIRIFVADNASTDQSVPYLLEHFPRIEIIRLDMNYGFAGGYNRALSTIGAEYFVLLNSDVQVTEGWLIPMMKLMDSDNLVGACMPKIRDFNHPGFFEYAGAAGGFIDRFGYTFCQGRIFDTVENDFGQYDEIREIFWASGSCLMVRGTLFKMLGGFDASFFAHMEEVDLCWRLKNRGYKIIMVPGSMVFHIGGGTLPQGNPFKTYLNFRNNLYLLHKNLPPGSLTGLLFRRIVLDYISAFRFLTKGSFRDIMAICKAHFSYFKTRKNCTLFRKGEKKFITAYRHRQIYDKSIVVKYFIRRKFTFKSLGWI